MQKPRAVDHEAPSTPPRMRGKAKRNDLSAPSHKSAKKMKEQSPPSDSSDREDDASDSPDPADHDESEDILSTMATPVILTPHHKTVLQLGNSLRHASQRAPAKSKASQQAGPSSPIAKTKKRAKFANTSDISSSPPIRKSKNQTTSSIIESSEPRSDLFVDNSEAEDRDPILWGNLARRSGRKYQSSEAHSPVVEAAQAVFTAVVLTGQEGVVDPWPEVNQAFSSRILGKVWIHCAKRLGDSPGQLKRGVKNVPTQEEARKILDYVASQRHNIMTWIRGLIPPLLLLRGGSGTAEFVAKLLEEDNFACRDYSTKRGRFLAPVISKAISRILFHNRHSLGRDKNTAPYFRELTGNFVCYVVYTIRVAISDWRSGQRVVERADNADLSWVCIKNTWDNQDPIRKKLILEKLMQNAKNDSPLALDESYESNAVENPFKDSLSDIDSDKDEAPGLLVLPSSVQVQRASIQSISKPLQSIGSQRNSFRPFHTSTSFAEATDVVEQLHDNGIEDLTRETDVLKENDMEKRKRSHTTESSIPAAKKSQSLPAAPQESSLKLSNPEKQHNFSEARCPSSRLEVHIRALKLDRRKKGNHSFRKRFVSYEKPILRGLMDILKIDNIDVTGFFIWYIKDASDNAHSLVKYETEEGFLESHLPRIKAHNDICFVRKETDDDWALSAEEGG